MRTILAALASVCLISSVAIAQNDRNDRSNEKPKHGLAHAGDEAGPFGSIARPQKGGTGNVQANGPASPGYHPNSGMMGRDNPESMRHDSMHRDFTRSERDRAHIDRNLDRFRGNFQADRRYHGGNWDAPQGYSYRHWRYGQRLPSSYFARNFWITGFASFGLMPPPPDAVWVRYGPDALLVDRDTGEIIRVQYGVFY